MESCEKHKDFIEGFDGSIKELAEKVGSLRYDSLKEFLQLLYNKLRDDGFNDYNAGRKKLGLGLLQCAGYILHAKNKMDKIWNTCKPHMKLHN